MSPPYDPDAPTDIDRVVAWLLGGSHKLPTGSYAPGVVPPGTPGILARWMNENQGDPVGPGQQLALIAIETKLTPPDAANSAIVTVEVQAVRAVFDGTKATAALGGLFGPGAVLQLKGKGTLHGASFAAAAAGAIIDVLYFT